MISEQTAWEAWLVQHPHFALTGGDDDADDSIDDDVDNDEEEFDSDESGDSDSEDGDSDNDDDSGEQARRLRKLERDNKRLQEKLEATIDLLNKKSSGEEEDGFVPEGYVPEEDYNILIDYLREDFVQNAIERGGPRNKDGSQKYQWESAEAVYRFLDLDDLEIDVASKTIDGLNDQLAAIADKYPFLLKGKSKAANGNGRTGRIPGKPGTREKHQVPSREAMLADFPAMAD